MTIRDAAVRISTFGLMQVPHIKCPEIDLAIEALEEKMPTQVTRVECCCCCEGLFELVSGRADVHVSPPAHCFSTPPTPVAVLCAFEVLLEESGGYMSDVMGDEIDLVAAIGSGVHTNGVLASGLASHGYMLHAMRPPFQARATFSFVGSFPQVDISFELAAPDELAVLPAIGLLIGLTCAAAPVPRPSGCCCPGWRRSCSENQSAFASSSLASAGSPLRSAALRKPFSCLRPTKRDLTMPASAWREPRIFVRGYAPPLLLPCVCARAHACMYASACVC